MISEGDIRTLGRLLAKIERPEQGLQQEVFDVLVKLVPFVACEMVVMNHRREILLTYRRDEFWQGWHFPGGLMRYNDTFEKRLKETVKRELGAGLKSHRFLFPINYRYPKNNPRGHAVSLVFLCQLKDKPKDGKFFAKMPKDIINDHRMLWIEVKRLVK